MMMINVYVFGLIMLIVVINQVSLFYLIDWQKNGQANAIDFVYFILEMFNNIEVSDGFVCPDPTETDQPGHYTRHAHPTDCRKFYVCIEGVARPYGKWLSMRYEL